MKTKLTIRSINSLPPAATDYIAWDEELTGFGLRVKPSGVRSFIIRYRNANGVEKRITLGKLGILAPEEARQLAKVKLADVVKGHDPAEQRAEQRRSMTMHELCTRYLAAAEKGHILGKAGRQKKASTLYVDRGRIERHILPLLGSRKVKELKTPDIIHFMRAVIDGDTATDIKTGLRGRAIVEGGRGTATRTVGLLGGIFSYAVAEGIIETNPVRGVKRPADNRDTERMTDSTYRQLGAALRAASTNGEPSLAVVGLTLLALTGCRLSEIQNLQWAEVDFNGSALRLRDSKEGFSIRPLSRQAIDVLKTQRAHQRTTVPNAKYVFQYSSTEKPYSALAKAWKRIKANYPNLANIKIKTFRTSLASIGNDLGYSEPTVGAILGHSWTRTITNRYILNLDDALIAAASKISGHIWSAMNSTKQPAMIDSQLDEISTIASDNNGMEAIAAYA